MPRKFFIGKVLSNKMQKTVVVSVEIPKRHPMYMKIMKNTKTFKARDDFGTKIGDVVRIEECVPYSREVTWKVIEVVESQKEDK